MESTYNSTTVDHIIEDLISESDRVRIRINNKLLLWIEVVFNIQYGLELVNRDALFHGTTVERCIVFIYEKANNKRTGINI